MKNITGIVLAGGKSSRFMSPKYKAMLDGRTLLEISAAKLKQFCDELIIVSKEPIDVVRDQRLKAKNKKNQDIRFVVEKESRFHPIVGVTEGLKASSNNDNLVLACDMPFISVQTLSKLIESTAQICVYKNKGRIEPLAGLYRSKALDKLKDFEDKKITELLNSCEVEYLESGSDLEFFNINTKEDLNEAKNIVRDNPKILGKEIPG